MARCQGECEGKLGNQDDWVKCGQCKLTYCHGCAGLKQLTWSKMNETKRGEWRCKQRCRNQRTLSEQEEELNEEREDGERENVETNVETNKELTVGKNVQQTERTDKSLI